MSHILDINSWEAESGGSRVPNQPGEYISVLQHLTTLHEALVQSLLAAEKKDSRLSWNTQQDSTS